MGKLPPNRSKVIHLITLLEFGGAQGNTLHTVRHLDAARFDAVLWAGRGAYWDKSAEEDLGKTGRLTFLEHLVRPVHPLHDVLAYFDLRKAFRETKPDIVHTHSSKAGIVGRLAAHAAGVPFIVHTFHGFGFNDRQNFLVRWFYIWLERLTAKFSHALIFVSQSNLQTALALNIGSASQYHLIHSGVALKDIRQRAKSAQHEILRREIGIPKNVPLITTIGPFKPQKNLGDFIKAAEIIHRQVPDAHFLIVGEGALRFELESQVHDAGLSEVFHMPGWHREVPEILAGTTVFALTSLWEGLPRSLVEALAIGIPSVCYETDGVSDLLVKGGGLVGQGKVAELAEEILFLLRDKKAWAKASERSKELIGKDFDIDQMVRQQEELYTDLDKARRIN